MKKVYLIGRSGTHGNKEILVENETIIGRDASVCQLVYPSSDRNISSVHCKVQNVNGNVQLTDLGSTNGTYLDTGVRLAPHTSQRLQSGQGFYLGDKMNSFAIRIQDDGAAPAQQPAMNAGRTPQVNKNGTSGTKGFSIASMVLGIVGVLLMALAPLAIICGIIGLVFGAYALATRKSGKGMAIAGFICSIVAISIPLISTLIGLAGLSALMG